MTSGARVVIAMLGAVVAIAIFVVVAFLLTDEPAVRCVEGEMQDNQVAPDGTMYPRIESFATIEEAEAFVCRHLPRPRRLEGLSLTIVRVARERNLAKTIEGEGGVFIEYEYALGDQPAVLRLGVNFPPPKTLPEMEGEALSIQGQQGKIAEGIQPNGEEGALVRWIKDGFFFDAKARLGAGLNDSDLLRILESVR